MHRFIVSALFLECAVACTGQKPIAHPSAVEEPTGRSQAGGHEEPGGTASTHGEAPEPLSGFIFVGCGFLFVDNDGRTPYSVLLPGEDAKQIPGEQAFILDGTLVEVSTTSADEVGVPEAREAALLRAHAQWESEHIRVSKGWQQLAIAQGGGELDFGQPGISAFMWGLDLPSEIEVKGQRVNRLAFVTAAIDSTVLVLGAPLPVGADPRPPAMKLGTIMRTLRRSTQRTDLRALVAEVGTSSKPWAGCPSRE